MIGASVGAAKRWRGGDTFRQAALRQLAEWRERERQRFLLLAPLLMILGVAAYLGLRSEPPLWLGMGAVVLTLGGWVLGERRDQEAWRLIARAGFFAALGFALVQLRAHALAAPVITHETPPVTIEGVLEAVESRDVGLRYTLRVTRIGGFREEDTPYRVRVSWRGRSTAALPGDRVRLRGVLSPPPGPALPGGYDYARQMWFERVGGVGYAYTGARVTVPADGLALGHEVERLREAVADRVQKKVGGQAGGLAAALVTGKRERVTKEVVDRLRDTGLAHLLAISGLHMGLVCGYLFLSVRLLLALSERAALTLPIKKIAAGAALVGGAGYLVLSGAPISAQRAFIMAAVTFGAVLFDRRAISLRNVALAALLVLLLRPEAAVSAGFQMSFMAVTVLVSAYGWWEGRRRMEGAEAASRRARPLRFVGGLFATSLLAGLATGPFAVYHFGRIATYGLLANMLVMPLVTLIVMPAAVLGLASMPFALDGPAWLIVGGGLNVVLALTGWVEGLPGAVQQVAQPSVWAWLCLVGGFLVLSLLVAPWRLVGLLGLPLAALLLQTTPPPDVFIGRDARQVAVRVQTEEGPRLSLLSRRRDRFSVEAWLRHLGLDPVVSAQPRFGECGEQACSVTLPDGELLSVVTTPEAAGAACRQASVVVYAAWAPHSLHDCRARLITTEEVAASGPVMIRGGALVSAADRRGCRLWARRAC